MRFPVLIAASSLLMFACDAAPEAPGAGSDETAAAPATAVPVAQDREAAARWDLSTNTLTQNLKLTNGLGQAYTPTLIGADGGVFAIGNAILFAVRAS